MERAQAAHLVGRRAAGPAPTCPTSPPPPHRTTARPTDARGAEAIGGDEPFIMQADGRAWLYAPAGLRRRADAHALRAAGVPGAQRALPGQRANPARQRVRPARQPLPPVPGSPGAEVFPYVFTTFRVTEHHTAGGMSRWTPYLNELQPEMFLEVSPELAARARPGATAAGRTSSPRGRRSRAGCWSPSGPSRCGWAGATIHQIGVPWHWGSNGLSTGDAANELLVGRARPERAHHGDQGRHLRHPARAGARTGPALVGVPRRLPPPRRAGGD